MVCGAHRAGRTVSDSTTVIFTPTPAAEPASAPAPYIAPGTPIREPVVPVTGSTPAQDIASSPDEGKPASYAGPVPHVAPPPYAPPTPSAAYPTPDPRASPDSPSAPARSRGLGVFIGAIVVVLIVVVGLVVLLHHSPNGAAASSGPGRPVPATAATVGSGASTTLSSAAPGVASDSPLPSASTSAPPSSASPATIGLVNVEAVRTNPDVQAVGALFDSYFSGINAKHYRQALADLDPSGSLNTNDPSQVHFFTHGISTTLDTTIVLHSIKHDTTGDGVLDARVTFNSHQNAGFGPSNDPNQTCTTWNITYVLTQVSDGSYLILRPVPANHHGC
jgi:hypothetical protein